MLHKGLPQRALPSPIALLGDNSSSMSPPRCVGARCGSADRLRPALVALLSLHAGTAVVVEAVCVALCNIVAKDAGSAPVLVTAGVIPPVVDALRTHAAARSSPRRSVAQTRARRRAEATAHRQAD